MTYEEEIEKLIDTAIETSRTSILQLGVFRSICIAGLLNREDDKRALMGNIREARRKWEQLQKEAERIFIEHPD